MYKITAHGVQRLDDGATIPSEPANTDWQAYQSWLALGNAPLPADEPPAPTLAQQLGPTDHEMARAGEDLFATLIAKGVIAKTDIPDVVVTHINARRAVRGQSAL